MMSYEVAALLAVVIFAGGMLAYHLMPGRPR